MPIEIKELHIRVAVNTEPGKRKSSLGKGLVSSVDTPLLDDEAKDALVAECVEQVLHILENKKER